MNVAVTNLSRAPTFISDKASSDVASPHRRPYRSALTRKYARTRRSPGAFIFVPTGEPAKMSDSKMADAATVDYSGPLRVVELQEGWYALGKGMLIPCRDRADAEAVVCDLTTNGTHDD